MLDYVATRKHAARNRAMLLMTHLSGMRVGEVAALRINDVLDADGRGAHTAINRPCCCTCLGCRGFDLVDVRNSTHDFDDTTGRSNSPGPLTSMPNPSELALGAS